MTNVGKASLTPDRLALVRQQMEEAQRDISGLAARAKASHAALDVSAQSALELAGAIETLLPLSGTPPTDTRQASVLAAERTGAAGKISAAASALQGSLDVFGKHFAKAVPEGTPSEYVSKLYREVAAQSSLAQSDVVALRSPAAAFFYSLKPDGLLSDVSRKLEGPSASSDQALSALADMLRYLRTNAAFTHERQKTGPTPRPFLDEASARIDRLVTTIETTLGVPVTSGPSRAPTGATEPARTTAREKVKSDAPRRTAEKSFPSVSELRDQIIDLKTSAKNLRDRGLEHHGYERARRDLEKAIDKASDYIANGPADYRNNMRDELADCYGILGGVERRWAIAAPEERTAHLMKSCAAYDAGYAVQLAASEGKVPQRELSSSYNLVRRLAVRVMMKPESLKEDKTFAFGDGLEPLNVKAELARARTDMSEKFAGRGSWWVDADRAIVNLLNGGTRVHAAFGDFVEKRPPDYAFASVLDVLRPLAELPTGARPALDEAVVFLEKERRRR